MRRGRRGGGIVAALAALVVLAGAIGCSDDGAPRTDDDGATDDPAVTTESTGDPSADAVDEPATGSEASSPFTVGEGPEGFQARSAGTGSGEPTWGEDSFGTDEPYLVLSPDGTPDHPDVVVVALTGYRGYQGGLDQASTGDPEDTDVTEVDGAEARYAAGGDGRWSDLVVAHGEDDVAIRIASPEADQDELAALVERVVVPDERTQPPSMPEPPDGLVVLGAVDAHTVLADSVYVDPQATGGPGPATAHGVGWLDGPPNTATHLSVLALPGRSATLDTLEVGVRWSRERWGDDVSVTRDGDAILVEDDGNGDPGNTHRAVWLTGPSGDVVVASARGPAPPELDVLADLARSVTPTDEDTWEAFLGEVRGGPDLNPTEGRTELMRGRIRAGGGWLLQDQPPGADGWAVDPCLVLTGGARTCPGPEVGETEHEGLWTATGRAEDGLAYVIVATTWPEADALFVTTDADTAIVPLVEIPGTDQKAAAVVGEGFYLDLCGSEPLPPNTMRRIELTTEDVSVVPCRS